LLLEGYRDGVHPPSSAELNADVGPFGLQANPMASTAAPMNRPEPTGEQSEDAIRRLAEQNHEGER
jgi:hypothetical protein